MDTRLPIAAKHRADRNDHDGAGKKGDRCRAAHARGEDGRQHEDACADDDVDDGGAECDSANRTDQRGLAFQACVIA
ncbi:hypothetical protein [Dokdonella sp.]|uniref:hypothetical protein n=1 Tax=Dokdonella sp. TaxID=2291710 RepID=UPI0035292816